MTVGAAYSPPHPLPLSPLSALIRTAWQREGNLLSLLPAAAYAKPVTHLGWSRRSILLVNQPDLMREVMTDPSGIYPKNDLMVGALEPLVGDSMFVSSGSRWRRQRDMIAPAFSQLRLSHAFVSMRGAVDDCRQTLTRYAQTQDVFSLDLLMSHLTADIICRSVFSTTLDSQVAREVFDAFEIFERSAAQVELKALIFDPPFKPIKQHESVLDACVTIRRHLGELVDSHLDKSAMFDDIASACIHARDSETGCPFNREELIDQLGVMFLAGHETTASALTWLFFIASQSPHVAQQICQEAERVSADSRELEYDDVRKLQYARAAFRETLRLYPPLTFIPRVASESTSIGGHRVKRGAMIMISPWTTHRNKAFWKEPSRFDPERFLPHREHELPEGCYLPFGLGPRTCIGAGFAQQEAALIVSTLLREFEFLPLAPNDVRPVARLTTRPARQILCRVGCRQ